MKRGSKMMADFYVKDVMLPNFIQVSTDQKHWLSMPVSQCHPKHLRAIGRAWTAALIAKSKVKEKRRG